MTPPPSPCATRCDLHLVLWRPSAGTKSPPELAVTLALSGMAPTVPPLFGPSPRLTLCKSLSCLVFGYHSFWPGWYSFFFPCLLAATPCESGSRASTAALMVTTILKVRLESSENVKQKKTLHHSRPSIANKRRKDKFTYNLAVAPSFPPRDTLQLCTACSCHLS